MKIDEFISSVLLDIDKGIEIAQEVTNKDYCVKDTKGGVSFDIAVTVTKNVGGNLKAEGKVSADTNKSLVEVVMGKIGVEAGLEGGLEVTR